MSSSSQPPPNEGPRGEAPWHPEAARTVAATGRDKFDVVQTPDWNPSTRRACTLLYHRYVEPAAGAWIPNAAFCSPLGDLSRWVFLEYLTRRCGVVLLGSNDPCLTRLEPFVLSPSVRGWDTPRYFAFSDGMRPMYQAIVDLNRLQRMNHLAQVVVADTGPEASRFYFGLDYRTTSAPRCSSTGPVACSPPSLIWLSGTPPCTAKAS